MEGSLAFIDGIHACIHCDRFRSHRFKLDAVGDDAIKSCTPFTSSPFISLSSSPALSSLLRTVPPCSIADLRLRIRSLHSSAHSPCTVPHHTHRMVSIPPDMIRTRFVQRSHEPSHNFSVHIHPSLNHHPLTDQPAESAFTDPLHIFYSRRYHYAVQLICPFIPGAGSANSASGNTCTEQNERSSKRL